MRTEMRQRAMRATAWMLAGSIAGMTLLAAPAQAQYLKEQRENRLPSPSRYTQSLTREQWQKVDRRPQRPDVRVLPAEEMRALKGRGQYRNRYLTGILPWHRSLRNVDLSTGNLFKTFDDLHVAPARGAGLALQY